MENSKTSLLKLLVALNTKIYISICNLCLYTKLIQHLPLSKLYPLLVSNIRWEIISIDFIVKLPKSTSFDIIMIVINLMSKKTHFISVYTIVTTESAIRLFFFGNCMFFPLMLSWIENYNLLLTLLKNYTIC